MKIVEEVFQVSKAVIGVVHLPPLPGSPRYNGAPMEAIVELAIRDARALSDGGVDGLLIENFGDAPYLKDSVEPSTIAAMTVVAREIRRELQKPMGINVLRNDAVAALAIAKVVDGKFIRANAYVEAVVTDQGIIEPCARRVQLAKKLYSAMDVKVFADVHVKHGAPLTQRALEDVAEEALSRGLADAVILTGSKTGLPPALEDIERVRRRLPQASIIVGSGCTPENVSEMLKVADAVIVGSYFRGGDLRAPVLKERVEEFMAKVKEIRAKA